MSKRFLSGETKVGTTRSQQLYTPWQAVTGKADNNAGYNPERGFEGPAWQARFAAEDPTRFDNSVIGNALWGKEDGEWDPIWSPYIVKQRQEKAASQQQVWDIGSRGQPIYAADPKKYSDNALLSSLGLKGEKRKNPF